LNAKINAFLSSQNYKFAITAKGFYRNSVYKKSVTYLFYNGQFSDISIITDLLRHTAYIITDGKVIKMERLNKS